MKQLFLVLAIVSSACLFAMIDTRAEQPPDKPKATKKFPRGLKPTPRHILASAPRFHPKIGNAAVPAYYFRLPKKLSSWGNDQYGDCVSAESAFNRACAGIFIAEAEVIRWARANGVLNGADLDQVIKLQQSRGFEQDGNIYGNGGGMLVNYADAAAMKSAIFQAGQDKGCISIGISADELPSGAGSEQGWFLDGNTSNSNEDHCTSICGYGTAQQFVTAMNASGLTSNLSVPSGIDVNAQGYAHYTWATIGFVTTKAQVGMMGEAWIRNPSTIISGSGAPTPDEVYVTGDPGPVPPVPPNPPTPPIPGTWPEITLSQDMKAGTIVAMPKGTPEAIHEADTAFQKLKGIISPIQPSPAPGGLEKRVDALENGINRINASIEALSKAILGNK